MRVDVHTCAPLFVFPMWAEVWYGQVKSRLKCVFPSSLCKVYIVIETWKGFIQSGPHAITFQSQGFHAFNPSARVIL